MCALHVYIISVLVDDVRQCVAFISLHKKIMQHSSDTFYEESVHLY